MPTNKRKLAPKPKQDFVEAKERELDTIREINKVLDQEQVVISKRHWHDRSSPFGNRCLDPQVDLAQLRKLSAVRGLVNSEV